MFDLERDLSEMMTNNGFRNKTSDEAVIIPEILFKIRFIVDATDKKCSGI